MNEEADSNWRAVLSWLIADARKPEIEESNVKFIHGAFTQVLWRISRGELDDHSVEEPSQQAAQAAANFRNLISNSLEPLGPGTLMFLEQKAYRGRKFIRPVFYNDFGGDPASIEEVNMYELQRSHRAILFFEGLRQQLLARKGIICPFNLGRKRCRCTKEIHSWLARLSKLAADGLFGSGEWSSLPCKR
jgi:hypothetical protein